MPELRIHVDISGLLELEAALAQLESGVEYVATEVLWELGARLMSSTKKKTPVDTGLLRRSWALGEIQAKEGGLEMELFNNVEYAEPVEYGHAKRTKKRAPEGTEEQEVQPVPGVFMLARSEEELKAILPELVQARTEAYLREVLG